MRWTWPWLRSGNGQRLVVAWVGQVLAYVMAQRGADGRYQIQKLGVERQGTDTAQAFVSRLAGLGLKGHATRVMLWPEQYQLLQIEAPAVAPDELRSAARYQIKEMLESHVDDVTLDVMRVGLADGQGQQKANGQLFVVAAGNAVVKSVMELAESMNWVVDVVDVQDTVQRNLQNAVAARDAHAERANAALVLVPGHQAVLTISASEELYYTRRFELPEGFLSDPWAAQPDLAQAQPDAYAPVEEYVPDYAMGGVSHGNDHSEVHSVPMGAASVAQEKAQRFAMEVQRSVDVWSRSWSSMPLQALRVYAGKRSAELAVWLSSQLGQAVTALDVSALFPGLEAMDSEAQAACLPLLGVLLRSEARKL